MISNASRYAAKLLFQFRFENEKKNTFRLTEERILVAMAISADLAYKYFEDIGNSENRKSKNDDGECYFFEFIGIVDMIHLGVECQDNEVWYSLKKLKTPMERKTKIVPEKQVLDAFKYESIRK